MRPWESVPGLDDSGGALLERPSALPLEANAIVGTAVLSLAAPPDSGVSVAPCSRQPSSSVNQAFTHMA